MNTFSKYFFSLPSALLVAALFYCFTLGYPLNIDSAVYAYMSQLFQKGHFPYVGSWDNNFPGILLIHIPEIAIFGTSNLAFRIWDITLQLLVSYFIYKYTFKLHSRSAAWLATVVCAIYYVSQGIMLAGQRDTYVPIFLLSSMLLVRNSNRSRKYLWLAGILSGMPVIFRPTYYVYSAAIFFYLWWVAEDRKANIQFLLGALLPSAFLVLFFLLAGHFSDFFQSTVTYNMLVYNRHLPIASLFRPFLMFSGFLFPILLTVVKYRTMRSYHLLFAMVALGIVILIPLNRAQYQYQMPLVLAFILASIGWISLGSILSQMFSSRSFVVPVLTILLAIGFVTTLRGKTVTHFVEEYLRGNIHGSRQAHNFFEDSPEFGYARMEDVAAYIEKRTLPSDRVQFFGQLSYPPFKSERESASRFISIQPLIMRDLKGHLQDLQLEWRKEYVSDMDRFRPKYFVVCEAPNSARVFLNGRLGQSILDSDFTTLKSYLASTYEKDTVLGAFTILRRAALQP